KCKNCRKPIIGARSSLATSCSVECAIALTKKESAAWDRKQKAMQRKALRESRKASREARERLKTRSEWLKDAQASFNAFIRERDKDLPCISCGRFHPGSWDAGHYRSVGAAPAIRFHEDNCHRQCVPCNQHKSGNAIEYRLGLIARIGQQRVEWLEGPHEPARYTIEDARRIRDEYRAKLKALRQTSERRAA
ncbi:MAG: recombination protein NinG, partial [Bradyrhizobium sp.]|nr:recombination protein NinG [Bradyrhizobium sp.]